MYAPPSIGPAGLTIPSYNDIRDYLLAQFRQIWGQDVYLGNDSAEYQQISVFALKISDTMKAIQLVYNNRSPATGIGAALDGLVKLNGIARKPATYSTCQVTLTGTPGTVITDGIVEDQNGIFWDLPASVTIGGGGTVTVTATCETIGAIQANPGQLSIISTPTAGWTSVTNAGYAVAGQPVESDSTLRARQAISTALPSITMLAGTVAEIAATKGVTRYNIVENYTDAADKWGNPEHSISSVVEGGTDNDVAMSIFRNRGIGCYTNGTTAILVTDPISGMEMVIRFSRPTYRAFTILCNVHLTGGTSATLTQIHDALVAYLNSLQIGEVLTISGLYAAALQFVGNPSLPLYSIRGLTAQFSSILTGSPTVNAGGSGYSVGDLLYINQPGSSLGAICVVKTLSGSAVATVTLIQNGVDYSNATGVGTVALTGAGSGCTLDIATGTSGPGTQDIAVAFDEVAQGISGNVTVGSV